MLYCLTDRLKEEMDLYVYQGYYHVCKYNALDRNSNSIYHFNRLSITLLAYPSKKRKVTANSTKDSIVPELNYNDIAKWHYFFSDNLRQLLYNMNYSKLYQMIFPKTQK